MPIPTCADLAVEARKKALKGGIHKNHTAFGVFYDRNSGTEHVVLLVDPTGVIFQIKNRDWQLINVKGWPGGDP